MTLLASTYHNCYTCSLLPCSIILCQSVGRGCRVVCIFVVGGSPPEPIVFYISGLGGVWFSPKCAVLKKCNLCSAG